MRNLIVLLFYFAAILPWPSQALTPFDRAAIPERQLNTVESMNFETLNLNGNFTLYNDSAAIPVDGTAGTQCSGFTAAISTSTPVTTGEPGHLLITKPSVNCQGTGVAYTVTLPGAKITTLDFDYFIASGTYSGGSSSADSDLEIWVYDVTNSVMIQPSVYKVDGVVGTTNTMHFKTWFQTSSGSASYRILIHSPNNTSATGFTAKIDNWIVRQPATQQKAGLTTDYKSCTATSNFTNTTVTCFKRRVGDSYEYDILLLMTGTPGAANLAVTLPTGDVIDTAKLTRLAGAGSVVGSATTNDSGVAGYGPCTVNYGSSTSVSPSCNSTAASGKSVFVTASAPFSFSTNDEIDMHFTVPIVGLGSTGNVSNDDGRRVYARYLTNAGQSISNNTVTIVDFEDKDTNGDSHGAVTTGASWKFTAPKQDNYCVRAAVMYAAAAGFDSGEIPAIYIYKNGAVASQRFFNQTSTHSQSVPMSIDDCVQLNAAEYLDVRVYQNSGGSKSLDGTQVGNFISITSQGGGSFISPTESVAAFYQGLPTGTLNSSYNLATVPTKVKDTHNAYSSGIYTVPMSGTYSIAGSLAQAHATTYTAGDSVFTSLYINGVAKTEAREVSGGGEAIINPHFSIVGYPLNAGDTVKLMSRNLGSSATFYNAVEMSWFSIVRTGP